MTAPGALRVLQLNSLLTGGGTDDQCVKLAAQLHRRGVRVCLAGPTGREFSRVARELEVPFVATPASKLGFILAAAKLARRERAQIVHGHHGRDIWRTVFAARLSGVRPKVVLTRHLAKSPGSPLSRRFLLGQVDALIAVSQFVAQVLREGHYEPDSPVTERRARPPMHGDFSKIRVIYGGIDTDRFRPIDAGNAVVARLRAEWGLGPEHFAFAAVGGYDLPLGKGQRQFLQAAARIHESVPWARFLIVGRGTMADLLRAEIDRLGLTGKAWLTSWCADMPAAMNAINCLVHSQIGTEAMPGVVFEAQACGRPVIASDLDGIPEAMAVGGLGRLVKPGSVEELARAMAEQAATTSLDLSRRGEMHGRVAAAFSVSISAANHAAFYRSLLSRERSGCFPLVADRSEPHNRREISPFMERSGDETPRIRALLCWFHRHCDASHTRSAY